MDESGYEGKYGEKPYSVIDFHFCFYLWTRVGTPKKGTLDSEIFINSNQLQEEMNNRQRVMIAISHQEPDRAPIGELLIDEKVRQKIYGGISYFEFLELVDLDLVFAYRGRKFERLDNGLLKDEWGVLFKKTTEEVPFPVKGPINNEKVLANYTPPDPTADYLFDQLREMVERFKGKRAIGFMMLDVFSIPSFLRGMDNFLVDLIENPSLAGELIEIVTEYQLKLIEGAIKEGAEIIECGCDYAYKTGPFMSPLQFKKFFLPGLTRLIKKTHEFGRYFMKHSDGNIWPLLDMIVDAGVDIINPLQPDAGMDIGEVKLKYGDRVCLMGNIDCGYILSRGSVDEVKMAVRECISKACRGGGYIMSSSNSIHSSVKPENYIAMIKATKEYGRYSP